MPETFVSLWDRPDLAVANALQGNFKGALRSIQDPDQLAPIERVKLSELMGFKDPGPLKSLVETATNPMLVLGAALAYNYPVNHTEAYLSQTEQFEKGLKPFVALFDDMASFQEIYKGTSLPAALIELTGRTHEFQMSGRNKLDEAAYAFKQTVGKPVDHLADIRVGLYRTQQSGYLEEAFAQYHAKLERIAGALDKSPATADVAKFVREKAVRARELADKIPKIKLTEAEQKLNDGLQKFYDWAHDGTADQDGIARAVERKASTFTGDRLRPPPMGEYVDSYHPILFKRTEFDQRHLQEIFTSESLASGQRAVGLRMGGGGRTVFSPSETERLLKLYMQNRATTGMNPAEFSKGFADFVKSKADMLTAARTAKVASGTHLARMFQALPDPDDLRKIGPEWEEFAGLIDLPEQVELAAANLDPHITREVMEQTGLGKFRLDAIGAAKSYNGMRARDYGWSVVPDGGTHTIGEVFNKEFRQLKTGFKHTFNPETGALQIATDAAGVPIKGLADKLKAQMLSETYMPSLLGAMTYKESMFAAKWDSLRDWAVRKLAPDAYLGKIMEQSGASKMRTAMIDAIAESPNMAYKPAMAEVAGYLHLGALGAPNMIAPIKNLFQTLITTIPEVGVQSTMKGLKDTTKAVSQYIDHRWNKGLDHVQAFQKAFPDFAKSGFQLSDTLLESLDQTHAATMAEMGPVARGYDRFKKAAMSLFSTTEFWNRAVAHSAFTDRTWRTFKASAKEGKPIWNYASQSWHNLPKNEAALLADPIAQGLVRNVASQGVAATQFGGGIANVPKFMAEWPQPLRQLTQFSVRYMNLLMRRGPGFWGAALAGTAAAIGLGKTLFGASGQKTAEEATMLGALPFPREGTPFYPLPLVPPVVQLGGGAAMAAMTGDTSQLQRSLPLLVPGGVGLARVLPSAGVPGSQTAGELFNRSYVPYGEVQPDGRKPLYTPEGKLIGYYTPMQLFARSVGLGDVNGTQELALSKWMLKYGDRISALKRDYVNALGANDTEGAAKIEEEYRRLNPGLGPMPVRKSEMRALHLRRDVSRIERQLETLPPEAREQFTAIAGVAFANTGPGFFGLQPGSGLSSGTTIGSREPYRLRPMGPGRDMQNTLPGEMGQSAAATIQQGDQTARMLSGGYLRR